VTWLELLTYAWTKQLSFDQFLTLAVAVMRPNHRPEPRLARQVSGNLQGVPVG